MGWGFTLVACHFITKEVQVWLVARLSFVWVGHACRSRTKQNFWENRGEQWLSPSHFSSLLLLHVNDEQIFLKNHFREIVNYWASHYGFVVSGFVPNVLIIQSSLVSFSHEPSLPTLRHFRKLTLLPIRKWGQYKRRKVIYSHHVFYFLTTPIFFFLKRGKSMQEAETGI